jgi:hypothetical protein
VKYALSAVVLVLALAACERAQTPNARKPDSEPWVSTATPFTAPGWKPGDQASWESQMRNRAAKQNEYSGSRPRD